ncbi:MAG: TIR domain-containing protein [Planctomycetota bacterium]
MSASRDWRALLDEDRREHPEVYRLAELLSIAVRIEPELARRMRLDLLPQAPVDVEGLLWFAPFVESRSATGIVFERGAADVLRERLGADPRRLHAARRVIDDVHAEARPLIRVEELATFLALDRTDPEARGQMERELGALVVALDGASGSDVRPLARWAARTLPALPAVARASDAARRLAARAGEQLGGVQIAGIPQVGEAAGTVSIGIRQLRAGVELSEPPHYGAEILAVEDTEPLVVDIEWPAEYGWEGGPVQLERGGSAIVGAPHGLVRARARSGDELRWRAGELEMPELAVWSLAREARPSDVAEKVGWKEKPLHGEVVNQPDQLVYVLAAAEERSRERAEVELTPLLNELSLRPYWSAPTETDLLETDVAFLYVDEAALESELFFQRAEDLARLEVVGLIIPLLAGDVSEEDVRQSPLAKLNLLDLQFFDLKRGAEEALKALRPVFPEYRRWIASARTESAAYDLRLRRSDELLDLPFRLARELDLLLRPPAEGDIVGLPTPADHPILLSSPHRVVRATWPDDLDPSQRGPWLRAHAHELLRPEGKVEERVYINYRPHDTGDAVDDIVGGLHAKFPPEHIFVDRKIRPGENWKQRIERELERATVLLVLIGPNWLPTTNDPVKGAAPEPGGERGFHEWMQLEVERSFERGLEVIPVLVEGGRMPTAWELELWPQLRRLTERRPHELGPDSFEDDLARLVAALSAVRSEPAPPNRADTNRALRRELIAIDRERCGRWVDSYAPEAPVHSFEDELAEHGDWFGSSRILQDLDEACRRAADGGHVVAVTGDLGSGKSFCIAKYIERIERQGRPVPRFLVHAGRGDTLRDVVLSLTGQLAKLDPEPAAGGELFADVLGRVIRAHARPDAPLVLVIDSLDRAETEAELDPWLEELLLSPPAGVALLISSAPDADVLEWTRAERLDLGDETYRPLREGAVLDYWRRHASGFEPPLTGAEVTRLADLSDAGILSARALRRWLQEGPVSDRSRAVEGVGMQAVARLMAARLEESDSGLQQPLLALLETLIAAREAFDWEVLMEINSQGGAELESELRSEFIRNFAALVDDRELARSGRLKLMPTPLGPDELRALGLESVSGHQRICHWALTGARGPYLARHLEAHVDAAGWPVSAELWRTRWELLVPQPGPLPAGKRTHVFLAYASGDRVWGLQLADELVRGGYEVEHRQFAGHVGELDGAREAVAVVVLHSDLLRGSSTAQAGLRDLELAAEEGAARLVAVGLDGRAEPRISEKTIYADFRDHEDGPGGGALLRFLFLLTSGAVPAELESVAEEAEKAWRGLGSRLRTSTLLDSPERATKSIIHDGQRAGLAWASSLALHCLAGRGLMNGGHYDAAVEVLNDAYLESPKSARPLQLLAQAISRRGHGKDLDDAVGRIDELREAGHRDPETRLTAARVLRRRYDAGGERRDLVRARDHASAAFVAAPDDVYAGIYSASTCVLADDLRRAQEDAARVLALIGEKTDAYWAKVTAAEAHLIRGEVRAAQEMLLPLQGSPDAVDFRRRTREQFVLLAPHLEISAQDVDGLLRLLDEA